MHINNVWYITWEGYRYCNNNNNNERICIAL